MANVETLLRDHVTLNVDCIDRLYLNGYVPRLQRPQNLWWFLHEHRKNPVVSPVLLKQLSDRFIAAIHGFALREGVPIVRFEGGRRKEEIAREHLARFKRDEGVVMIGVAQEKVSGFRVVQKGPRRRHRTPPNGKAPCFSFYRGDVYVNQYYFYIFDRDFGLLYQVLVVRALRRARLAQRPRVGQAPTRASWHRLRGSRQRLALLRRRRGAARDLRRASVLSP
ncbi:MAG TPA: hypothetical protein VGB13_06180 [Candidatus Krumholzibacteria bacterium]